MSVITFPDICVSTSRWKLKRNELVSRSVFGAQSIEASTPLWSVSYTGVPEYVREAVRIEQFLEALAGLRNQTELYNRAQPEPFGTMRGSWVLEADASDGATTLSIDGGALQAGRTVLQGDLIGLGTGLTQQVIRVAADATANGSGVITLSLNSPLRNSFDAGDEVRWDKPKILARQVEDNSGILYVPGAQKVGQAWSLDFIEDVRP